MFSFRVIYHGRRGSISQLVGVRRVSRHGWGFCGIDLTLFRVRHYRGYREFACATLGFNVYRWYSIDYYDDTGYIDSGKWAEADYPHDLYFNEGFSCV